MQIVAQTAKLEMIDQRKLTDLQINKDTDKSKLVEESHIASLASRVNFNN